MSLAARCPACGTVFRVVQDQLRVSEGWVRCGRCAEVFNAIESLVDLEADAATRPNPKAARSDRVLEDLARVGSGVDIELAPDADAAFARPAPPAAAGEGGASQVVAASAPDAEAAEADSMPAGNAGPPAPAKAPEFVRRADRAARWRQPGVRLALGGVGIAAAALLAGQAALEYRDMLAAQWPTSRPALEQLCAALDCRVGAPRLIDGLAVESSGLVRIEGSPNYRLSVVLRNRTAFAVAAPAIDLTLTDSQGSVIARRVLRAAELGTAQESLAARSDLSLQASLAAMDRPVSGYTIEIFYP